MLPLIAKNDTKAKILIWTVSIIVFVAVVILSKYKLIVDIGFNPHLFALANAIINSMVAVLLLAGLIAIKQRKLVLHRTIMLSAISLSVLFLLCYIGHHLLAGETKYGDINHDGIISETERLQAGGLRTFYYILLVTHIPLAAIILPFILFTAYRALTGEYGKHKKLTRITWPIWFYVAITGVIVYWMINPYYS